LIRLASSATKHGVSEADIKYVIAHCGYYFRVPSPAGSRYQSDRFLFLGDNDRQVALEVMATPTERGICLYSMPDD